MTARDIVMGAAGNSGDSKTYIEDVFSTYVFDGNNASQTINNGIDLAGKGGMVWLKQRNAATQQIVLDTARGTSVWLKPNQTSGNQTYSGYGVTSFNANGFTVTDSGGGYQCNTGQMASWTFRKAPKFFDVVTYTGDGTNSRQIPHSLGVAPGMVIAKKISGVDPWFVYHRSAPTATDWDYTSSLRLNTPAGGGTIGNSYTAFGDGWSVIDPTSATFTVGNSVSTCSLNASGQTYVAYLFAHDTTTDGLIQCGSYTGTGSPGNKITLGWEPQWILIKGTDKETNDWYVVDNMRGVATSGDTARLSPNLSNAEVINTSPNGYGRVEFHPDGFSVNDPPGGIYNRTFNGAVTYIYMAIRRGPMKTPTDATKVFALGTASVTSGFPIDMYGQAYRTPSQTWSPQFGVNRLSQTGLQSSSTAAEYASTLYWDNNSGIIDNGQATTARIYWTFRRAPGFFDVVCYTGNGSAKSVSHNLGVPAELAIVKRRDNTGNWKVGYGFDVSRLVLNSTDSAGSTTANSGGVVIASMGVSSFYVSSIDNANDVNASGSNYVAYLFASCPGVSKVGTYTGNGSSQTINCGFASGARFVLIKRTDSTGDWMVWDTARGIVAGTDPHLSLNTTAAEVTTDDTIDPDSTGFIVNQVAATNVNVSSATYIYLAIA